MLELEHTRRLITMGKIIKEAETVHTTAYYLQYDYNGHDGWGFSFKCDKDGNVDLDNMNEAAKKNYFDCVAGLNNTNCKGILKHNSSYKNPAILLCDCKRQVVLSGFTNTCDRCGLDYNWNGQMLAPRNQWGEDTGEHIADILRIP
jgi:hypothetical protein